MILACLKQTNSLCGQATWIGTKFADSTLNGAVCHLFCNGWHVFSTGRYDNLVTSLHQREFIIHIIWFNLWYVASTTDGETSSEISVQDHNPPSVDIPCSDHRKPTYRTSSTSSIKQLEDSKAIYLDIALKNQENCENKLNHTELERNICFQNISLHAEWRQQRIEHQVKDLQ